MSDCTGQYISLKTMQSLEGLGIVAAGSCIFKGSPAMSFDSLSKFLDSFLPQSLAICLGFFGLTRTAGPCCEKEDIIEDQGLALGV